MIFHVFALAAAVLLVSVRVEASPLQPDAPRTAAPPPGPAQPESLDQGLILIVKDLSGRATATSPLYLASNLGGWNPGDPAMRLEGRSDMRWQIALPRPPAGTRLEFKFTRGAWDLCEVAADLSDIPNRTLPAIDVSRLSPGERPVFEFEIPAFSDQRPQSRAGSASDPYRVLNVTGQVRRVQIVGSAPTGGPRVRELLVWLPPGYDEPENRDRRYPVLYLHDGQNIFEQLPGVPGEWRADETAARLIEAGRIEPLIIVGVPHAGPGRSSEYLPVPAIPEVTPMADEYLRFLTGSIMPRVQRIFRVQTGPEVTAIGGASLGAVISLYSALERPDLFGKVLAESTPTLSGPGGPWEAFLDAAPTWPLRIYIGMGGKEAGVDPANDRINALYVESARRMEARMAGGGVQAARRRVNIDPEAVHDENAWAARLPDALEFLFPREVGIAPSADHEKTGVSR